MEPELPTEYDVIVLGTGLVECIVAAAAARIGKKVLHIDQNEYYGGNWASFTLAGLEQWVTDHSVSHQHTRSDCELELEDGETSVPTSDPHKAHSNIQLTWHIPDTIEPEQNASSSQDKMPDTSTAEPVEEGNKQVSEEEIEVSPCEEPSETSPEIPSVASPSDHQKEGSPQEEQSQSGSSEETQMHPDTTEEVPKKLANSKKWSKEEVMKLSRKFNLDLAPKLLFARGPLVELLISSNVARYTEFKCITRVLTWRGSDENEGGLVVVPCSRSDVFTTKSVSVVEKRLLMKLLEFCHSYDEQLDKLEEFKDKSFVEFLQSRKQTPNLIHFITEAIAMVPRDVPCLEGLEKTKRFLSSLGRYGTTPYLFSMYGSGELPQAFCRLCAVFEGTYVLRREVSSFIIDSENQCLGLISEGQRFKCSHLVMDVSYAPPTYVNHKDSALQQKISRGIFITDRSILPNEKEQLTVLRLPVDNENLHPVIILEVGSGSGICPKDLYCTHMTCYGNNAEEDLKVAVKRLFADGEDVDKPTVLWSLYFNQDDSSSADLVMQVPGNIYLCSGPDGELDHDSAIVQAQSVFCRMFPEEEFLPRAPDPDEIVFDNPGSEPKEGDNFENKTTEESEDKLVESSEINSETSAPKGENSTENKIETSNAISDEAVPTNIGEG